MQTPSRFAPLRRLALSAVMVGTGMLALCSWAIVRIDYAYIGTGDRVLERLEGLGYVESVDDENAIVKMDDGSTKIFPIADLTEM